MSTLDSTHSRTGKPRGLAGAGVGGRFGAGGEGLSSGDLGGGDLGAGLGGAPAASADPMVAAVAATADAVVHGGSTAGAGAGAGMGGGASAGALAPLGKGGGPQAEMLRAMMARSVGFAEGGVQMNSDLQEMTPEERYKRLATPQMPKIDLWHAAGFANGPLLMAMLEDGMDVNALDDGGHTALHWAALNGHIPIAHMLIQRGIRINVASTQARSTPLHWAAINGHVMCLHFLVQKGADWHARDAQGCDVFLLAAQNAHLQVLQYLRLREQDLFSADTAGHTALHWACYNGHYEVAEALLDMEPQLVNKQDNDGCTAMHWAARQGHNGVCRLLMDRDADHKMLDSKLRTAMTVAAEKGHKDTEVGIVNYAKSKKYQKALPGERRTRSFVYFVSALMLLGLVHWAHYYLAYTPEYATAHVFFLFATAATAYSYYKVQSTDAGSLVAEDPNPDIELLLNVWSTGNLCMTCKLPKPERSKHDRVTNRCVARFDHFCVWTNNAIGAYNHGHFLLFCVFITLDLMAWIYLTWAFFGAEPSLARTETFHTWIAACATSYPLVFIQLVILSILTIFSSVMVLSHCYQISINMTTNEYMNMGRYSYLFELSVPFSARNARNNKYNKGIVANWREFLFERPPVVVPWPTMDELREQARRKMEGMMVERGRQQELAAHGLTAQGCGDGQGRGGCKKCEHH